MHERGTMVEAYFGALYEQCNYIVSPDLAIVLDALICQLRHFLMVESKKEDVDDDVENSEYLNSSQFKQQIKLKKAKSLLLEIMQKRGVTHAGKNATYSQYGLI